MKLDLRKYSIITKNLIEELVQNKALITEIVFANNTIISDYAFAGCINLEKPTYLANVKSIGAHAFEGCTLLLNNTQGRFENIESISDYAFAGCSSITYAKFGNTLIGKHAFENCTALSEVVFTTANFVISDYAFAGCINLAKPTYINKNVKSIGAHAFEGCTLLYNGTLKISYDNISSISDYAFASCYNFPQQITLPKCTEIGRYAFLSCENLSSLTARKCTFVDYNAFYGTKLWDIEPSEV